MEPGQSGSGGSGGGGGISSMPERAVQQMILNPIPGPSTRPFLAQPVQVPPHFLIPPGQLLPHQVRSGIDIGNLFKLLNALQNRIALACGQHQFLRDPLNQPRPPEDGGYKPLTPQAAVRDIRSLCRQQRNLMEKLRRWNCTNDGKCYDLVVSGVYTGICTNCEPFAASRIRMKRVNRALRRQRVKASRRALKKLTAAPTKSKQQQQQPKKKVEVTVSPTPLLPPPCQPPRKRRKKSYVNPEPPHPDSILSQENFLSELGLVTPEVYQRTQAESKRTERRRRTTANPRYKSNAFVDPNEVGKSKRSRRSDPNSLELSQPSTSSPTGAERRRAKQKRYECTVCEKKDVTVQCSRCMSGFHPECIRVTASKAPQPTTVSVCPNCVHCNPSIRSSDCILLSRRMSRPSIMGLKSDPEPGSSGNHRQAHSPRHQKAASKRRAAAKHYSKSVRRNASSAKSKKPSFKPQTVSKPRKTAQNSKKSYAKRTLNHSLAVAAAAAVPAYCTSASVEPTSAQEKASGNSAAPRKRKLDAPAATATTTTAAIPGSKLHKSKYATTLPASDRRGHCTKRELSCSMPLPSPKAKETTPSVKKTLPVKPSLPLVPSEDRSNCFSKKHVTKPKEIQDGGVVLSQKNSSTTGCIQPFHPGGSKTSTLAAQQKVDSNGRLKNSKLEKMEENIIPVESEAPTAPSKAPTGKSKKGNNGAKPGSLDPFCMKRTMMAMSAAAGIVLSSSGIKVSSLSSASPSPPTPPIFSDAVLKPASLPEISSTASNNSCNQEIDKSGTIATEGKVKAVHKSPKTTMLSPLTNLSNKSCEKEIKKAVGLSSTGKAVQKAHKAANTVPLPITTTLNNGPCKKELHKSDSLPTETSEKTVPKPIKHSPAANARETKPKTAVVGGGVELKKKSVQKVPKPAIISQITVLKNKCAEKVVCLEAPPPAKETVTNCVQSAAKSVLPFTFTKSGSSDTTIRKSLQIPTEANGKNVPPRPAIIANLAAMKNKLTDKETKNRTDQAVGTEPKAKTTQKSPQQPVTHSPQLSPQKPSDKEANKKPVTPKAKKVPKPIPKMDPALEQSISETINRVILESTSADKAEEQVSDLKSVPSKNSSKELNQSTVSYEDTTCISEKPTENTKKYSPDSWELNLPPDDFNFSYAKFSLNGNDNGFCVSNERERPTSPASNSSTIGSPRSLRDLESDDSSDDLLSIPDTPLAPYLELKRLEKPGPFLDLSAIDRLEEYRKNLASSSTSKRGRPSGRGRGGRH